MSYLDAGGLWRKTGKSGKVFYSGQFNTTIPQGSMIFVFKNLDKEEGDARPDLLVRFALPDPHKKPALTPLNDNDIF